MQNVQVDDMFDDVDFYTSPPFPSEDLKAEILEGCDDEDESQAGSSDSGPDDYSFLTTPRKR